MALGILGGASSTFTTEFECQVELHSFVLVPHLSKKLSEFTGGLFFIGEYIHYSPGIYIAAVATKAK